MIGRAVALARWAGSGAMALTGPASGPPSPAPAGLAMVAFAAADDLAAQTARWGRSVVVDGPALLAERAAFTGMRRQGSTSVGGSARFVEAADGWFALNLPRPEDVAALPALVSEAISPDDWPAIAARLRTMTTAEIVEQATLLGLAVGVAPTAAPPSSPARELIRGGRRRPRPTPLVVDLTSLWAGPLAAGLLASAGARVVKVEGRHRPDGARNGSRAFYDLLNSGKECLALDFACADDRALLQRLIAAADLVIEGSRARVIDGLGIDPHETAAAGTSWISITAHGRSGTGAERVGFGDDAAVAGGLVLPGMPPMFVADAVADPLTGLVAAVHAADLLASEHAAVVDVPLARVAAWASSPAHSASVGEDDDGWAIELDDEGTWLPVAEPRHRPVASSAPPTDAHGEALRLEFGPAAVRPG